MATDVFISYSRRNEPLCDAIKTYIETELGYTVFVDRDQLIPGCEWLSGIDDAINADEKPHVVFLGTTDAVNKPDVIAEELRLARERGLPIVPVEFDDGVLTEFGFSTEIHHIDARKSSRKVDAQVQKGLQLALNRKVLERLPKERVQAREWCHQVTRRLSSSFWRNPNQPFEAINHNINGANGSESTNIAIVAPGGSGKSVLIARYVQELLKHSNIFPVIVQRELLCSGKDGIARLVGVSDHDLIPESFTRLENQHQQQVIFVVDGLDQISPQDFAETDRIFESLLYMREASGLIIGCRDNVWETRYSGRTNVTVERLQQLSIQDVEAALDEHGLPSSPNLLLRIPLFLDLVIRHAGEWGDGIPSTQSEMLQKIWATILKVADPTLPEGTDGHELFEKLAAAQLEAMRFDVNSAVVSQGQTNIKDLIKFLGGEGVLVEDQDTNSIRLRHDLLDSYNVCRILLPPSAGNLRQRVYKRSHESAGWTILSTLVNIVAESPNTESILKEIFAALLTMLDCKDFSPEANQRAWAATYVLTEQFDSLLTLILKTLDGEVCDSLTIEEVQSGCRLRASQLEPTPKVTQQAGSSLASAFRAIARGQIEDAGRVLPVLIAGLTKWKWRKRFVEAIAKYQCNEAREALANLTTFVLGERDDLPVLGSVATALRQFNHNESTETLLKIINADTSGDFFATNEEKMEWAITRRNAILSFNFLRPAQAIPEPPYEDNELIWGLRIWNGKSYSDWRDVQKYAKIVEQKMITDGQPGYAVVSALIRALRHDQLYARCPVASALGDVTDERAVDALLMVLVDPFVQRELMDLCVKGLTRQLEWKKADVERQQFRLQCLRAALEADTVGNVDVSKALRSLALDTRKGDWLIDNNAVEATPPDFSGNQSLRAYLTDHTDPVPGGLANLFEPEELAKAGAEWEPKLRLVEIDLESRTISLEHSSWQLAATFHEVASSDPGRIRNALNRIPCSRPLENTPLPGILCIHFLVQTSDEKIIIAKRSEGSKYYPAHWAASFEEGVTLDDIQAEDFIHCCFVRGLREEFNTHVDEIEIVLLSTLVEVDNLNFAIVVFGKLKTVTFDQLKKNWGQLEPSKRELVELASLDVSPAESNRNDAHLKANHSPLHPTSSMRLAMHARYQSSDQA